MQKLRKAAEVLFDYLEKNNIKDFKSLPPEQLLVWMIIKEENLHKQLSEVNKKNDEEKELDNVIQLKRN